MMCALDVSDLGGAEFRKVCLQSGQRDFVLPSQAKPTCMSNLIAGSFFPVLSSPVTFACSLYCGGL